MHKLPHIFMFWILILAKIITGRCGNTHSGSVHTHTQPCSIIFLHPSVIVNFLLGWTGTGRQEREMEGAEPSHAARGKGGGGRGRGGKKRSLIPDLWLKAYVTQFVCDSKRPDVILVNDGQITKPIWKKYIFISFETEMMLCSHALYTTQHHHGCLTLTVCANPGFVDHFSDQIFSNSHIC